MTTANKAILIIMGIITVIGGIWCAATPGMTYITMVLVAGCVMFFHAIEEIITYRERKSMGMADGWSLAGAIIACLCAALIIISWKVQFLTGIALLYFLFTWLVIAGIISIMGSFRIKKHTDTGIQSIDSVTGMWWTGILIGIIMIIAGCMGFAYPLIAMISIGFIIGFDIISAGVSMLVRAFTL